MSEILSVNKIKSLTQQIELVTGKSHSDLTVAIQVLKDGYESDSGGSGIIDVTELPTIDIDENAVYRLTESVQTSITQVYGVVDGQVMTLNQYIEISGISTTPAVYVVDELSNDLKTTDVITFSEINIYILRSDGKAYLNSPDLSGWVTFSMLAFQGEDDPTIYDKGFTDNPYEETEEGIYTTIEAYKEVIRYFIRKSGEWEEISATMSKLLLNNCTDIDVLSGTYRSEDITVKSKIINVKSLVKNEKIIPSKVIVDTPNPADFFEMNTEKGITEITLDDFYKKDGTIISTLKPYAFAYMWYLKKVTLPDTITNLPEGVFKGDYMLENITIPETVKYIRTEAFYGCGMPDVVIPASVMNIESKAFANSYSLLTVTFKGIPTTSMAPDIFANGFVQTINVPWSEGEVSNAPWGAANATINYNYTEG